VIFGLGRYRILEAVSRRGSMQGAAKELKMSYRAVWMRVRTSEQRMGKQLVVREGKGSRLTSFAVQTMKKYKRLQRLVERESDESYNDLMTDGLEKK
jgi:molybdate transport system regulatory protein